MPRPNSTLPAKTIPTMESGVVYRANVPFNAPGAAAATATTVRLGRIPVGGEIIIAKIKIATPFADSTTATISMGTNSPTFDNIMGAVDATAAANSSVTLAATALALEFTQDTDVFLRFNQTGAVVTAGLARGILSVSAPLQG